VLVALTDTLLIPYGVAEWSPDGLAIEGFSARALKLRAPFPCAAINRAARQPLRLNNSVYDSAFAPDLDPGADQADLVRNYLKALCRPWDKVATQFLDAYFAFAAELIEENRGELSERLAPYAGLYDYRHFLFSAPKPLPRAHLYAPPDTGVSGGPADFSRADFAFWLGNRLVAALSAQGALTPKKAREQADRLRLAGIEVVPFQPGDLAGDKASRLFRSILGPSLRFWEGQAVPIGAFRGTLLED
jgi:hypothetical protein